ncbi:hypothetical protein [Modestobacter sp. SYSU DS0511]
MPVVRRETSSVREERFPRGPGRAVIREQPTRTPRTRRPHDQNAENEGNPLIRTMRGTVGRESTTFGFSATVTAAFGALQVTQGSPDLPRVSLFAAGAVASFTVLEGLLSNGFRQAMPQHRTRTLTAGRREPGGGAGRADRPLLG